MSRDLWRLFLISAVSVLAGFLTGQYFLCLSVGLALYIFLYYKKLSLLLYWLQRNPDSPPPDYEGVINEVVHEFDELRAHYKHRGEKLSGYLRQFQHATNALPDAVVVLGEYGTIEWANEKAREYLDVRWPQDAGQRIANLVRHPELADFLKQLGQEVPRENIDVELPNKESVRLEFRIAPFGENHKVMVARDITNIHKTNKMRKDFIANASHELRTPLTVIAGYLEAFEGDEDCPQSWLPMIKQMRTQTGRMQRLIDDLLQLSSLESQDRKVKEDVMVAELLSAIYKEAVTLSGELGHIFYLETDPKLWLKGDQKELYSAFSNLIFNAIQYTPEHGVIRIRWYADEMGAHMEVTDTGEGIPSEHISRLTERFYRVDKGRSREKGGTGLGLAIVKHVLARHNATLHIESVYGVGSTFRCDFPKNIIITKPPAANISLSA